MAGVSIQALIMQRILLFIAFIAISVSEADRDDGITVMSLS